MNNANAIQHNEDEVLRYHVTDDEIEVAAAPAVMTYTYQTSAYNRCCR